jgi:hypothetical protein
MHRLISWASISCIDAAVGRSVTIYPIKFDRFQLNFSVHSLFISIHISLPVSFLLRSVIDLAHTGWYSLTNYVSVFDDKPTFSRK